MRLQRNFRTGIGLIVILYVAMSFFSIALLEKAFPDVPATLKQHLIAESALQKITQILNNWDKSSHQRRGLDANQQIKILREVYTKDIELDRLDAMAQKFPAAIDGDPVALLQIAEDLHILAASKHQQMVVLSDRFQLISLSTSWTVAIIASAGLAMTLLILMRFKHKILDPYIEVLQVLNDWKSGNKLRRCNLSRQDPEIREAFLVLNEILDQSLNARPARVMHKL